MSFFFLIFWIAYFNLIDFSATLRAGSQCHSAIEKFYKGVPCRDIQVSKSWLGLWRSVQSIFEDITDVSSVEGKTIHPHLKYYGYADCVAKYK